AQKFEEQRAHGGPEGKRRSRAPAPPRRPGASSLAHHAERARLRCAWASAPMARRSRTGGPAMIRGIHVLLSSSDAEATRAFFRDQVRLPGTDVGEGWWIFDFPEGDLGVHPVEEGGEPGTHDVSFYCDEIQRTVADLESRGGRLTGPVQDHGYGLVTYFEAPGGTPVPVEETR